MSPEPPWERTSVEGWQARVESRLGRLEDRVRVLELEDGPGPRLVGSFLGFDVYVDERMPEGAVGLIGAPGQLEDFIRAERADP